MAYQKHIHLEQNLIGNDYIMGDLHGNYSKLLVMLDKIQFDKTKDRLFSVGDLIDRGPESLECAQLIYEPWFYSAIGNHEYMMVMTILKNCPQHKACWEANGGLWYKDQPTSLLDETARKLAMLPMIISVGTYPNRFNICHAELIAYDHYHDLQLIDDSWIDEWKFNSGHENDILWGREIIDSHWSYHGNKRIFTNKQFHSKLLSPTYVGHSMTQTRDIQQFQQHIYLDTGCSLGFNLTIASPTLNKYFQLNKQNILSTKNLNDIQKINIP